MNRKVNHPNSSWAKRIKLRVSPGGGLLSSGNPTVWGCMCKSWSVSYWKPGEMNFWPPPFLSPTSRSFCSLCRDTTAATHVPTHDILFQHPLRAFYCHHMWQGGLLKDELSHLLGHDYSGKLSGDADMLLGKGYQIRRPLVSPLS